MSRRKTRRPRGPRRASRTAQRRPRPPAGGSPAAPSSGSPGPQTIYRHSSRKPSLTAIELIRSRDGRRSMVTAGDEWKPHGLTSHEWIIILQAGHRLCCFRSWPRSGWQSWHLDSGPSGPRPMRRVTGSQIPHHGGRRLSADSFSGHSLSRWPGFLHLKQLKLSIPFIIPAFAFRVLKQLPSEPAFSYPVTRQVLAPVLP